MQHRDFFFEEYFDSTSRPASSFSSSSEDFFEAISIGELVPIPFNQHPLYRESDKNELGVGAMHETIIPIPKNKKNFELSIEKMLQEELERSQGLSPLLAQVLIGMVRDFVWALLTFRNADYFNGKLGAFWGPSFTQSIGSFLPTFGMAVKLTKLYSTSFLSNKENWLKTTAAYAAASWLSIPPWNIAQYIGQIALKTLGLEEVTAGYMTGLFTGLTETAVQNLIVIPHLLDQPLEPWEIMLNTLGGAVWQWVYQANLSDKPVEGNISLQEITAATEVAGAVALSTLLMTSLAWKIKKLRSQKTPIEMTTMADENNDIAQEKKEATPLLANTSRLFHRSPAININIQEDQLKDTPEDKWFYRQK